MRRVVAVSFMALPVVLAGCGGGGGSSSPSVSATTSPFEGNYQGTNVFNNGTGTESSNVTATVATNGAITGTYTVTADSGSIQNIVGQQGSFIGTISNAGTMTVVIRANGSSSGSSANGTVAFANNGHLEGTLAYTNGSSTVDFVKQ